MAKKGTAKVDTAKAVQGLHTMSDTERAKFSHTLGDLIHGYLGKVGVTNFMLVFANEEGGGAMLGRCGRSQPEMNPYIIEALARAIEDLTNKLAVLPPPEAMKVLLQQIAEKHKDPLLGAIKDAQPNIRKG